MIHLRRIAYASLVFAFGHVVFGAIVRITGSGLGCGDQWPKCHGYWVPPMERPDLIIEVTHRYLALGLTLAVIALVIAAFRRRGIPGVAGPGSVLRAALLSAALVVAAALLGAVVVKLELTNKYVIVLHLTLAMSLIASLAVAAVRAGGFGAGEIAFSSRATARGAAIAAALALLVIVLGGLTAHLPGANAACQGFPHCARGTLSSGGILHIHLAHRIVAFALLFHGLGLAIGVSRRGEARVVARAARLGLGLLIAQILIAAALVEMQLPAALRSLHQAVGTAVWLVYVAFAALAWRGMRHTVAEQPDGAPRIGTVSLAAVTLPADTLAADTLAASRARPHSIAVIIGRGADF